jgi:hypothetical protein
MVDRSPSSSYSQHSGYHDGRNAGIEDHQEKKKVEGVSTEVFTVQPNQQQQQQHGTSTLKVRRRSDCLGMAFLLTPSYYSCLA